MNYLVNVIRDNWPQNINEISRVDSTTVSNWLKIGDFEPIREIDDSDNFCIGNYTGSFLFTNAYEVEKMACVCIETLIALEHRKVNIRSMAWMIVKLYYSSFYAAHALIRSMGYLCIHIDNDTASRIKYYSSIYYQNCKKPNQGYYLLKYESNDNKISFSRNINAKGSHQFLWRCVMTIINDLLQQLSSRSRIYQPYIVSLLKLRDIMCLRGNSSGNWLSVIRNDVTYKHTLGVWYPNRGLKRKLEIDFLRDIKLSRKIVDLNLDISNRDELVIFVNAAMYLNILMIDVINDLINRNSKNKSFLKKNYMHVFRYLDLNMSFLHSN